MTNDANAAPNGNGNGAGIPAGLLLPVLIDLARQGAANAEGVKTHIEHCAQNFDQHNIDNRRVEDALRDVTQRIEVSIAGLSKTVNHGLASVREGGVDAVKDAHARIDDSEERLNVVNVERLNDAIRIRNYVITILGLVLIAAGGGTTIWTVLGG